MKNDLHDTKEFLSVIGEIPKLAADANLATAVAKINAIIDKFAAITKK